MYRVTVPGAPTSEVADLYDALAQAEEAYLTAWRASWPAGVEAPRPILTWRLEWHHDRRRRLRLLADGMVANVPKLGGAHVDETILPTTVTCNPKYCIRFDDGGLCAVYRPGGFWAIKVRQRGDQWAGFAVPRKGTSGEPFDIVTGPDKQAVWYVAMKWAEQSSIMTVWGERFIFAGYSDTTEETPLPTPATTP